MNWIEKYRPKTFSEIRGQDMPIVKIKAFVNSFSPSKKKALLLYGAPGTGKTTLVHVFAKETNSEIFELNASDLRNKDKLKSILRPAIEQKSLTKSKKIILLDEVDGISGTDRGGLLELISLISISIYPIILTANDVWKKKLSNLRKKSELLQLKDIDRSITENILNVILKKEDKYLGEEILKKISKNSNGDLRAAINDLQSSVESPNPSEINFSKRNKEEDIFNALKKVFQEFPNNEILRIYDSVNLSIDEIMLWIEENIPLEYNKKELMRAYEALANADRFKGRIYKQQYWRFLVYENIFLSYAIAAAKVGIKSGFKKYKRPERILKIWINNQKTAKKKSIAAKYAPMVHSSQKETMKDFYFVKQILKYNPKTRREIDLSEEEVEYILR